MPVVNPEKLVSLQNNADGIRNVSVELDNDDFGVLADRRTFRFAFSHM